MSVGSVLGLHSSRRRIWVFVSLIIMVLIAFLCIYAVIVNRESLHNKWEPVVEIQVGTEEELRNAINDLPLRGSAIIILTADIYLTDSFLMIPADKNVTLTSNKTNGFYKLFGTMSSGASLTGPCVIGVSGVLMLDGVVVTHAVGSEGRGVWVFNGGHFVMYRGEISGNTAVYDGLISNTTYVGGGVCNEGVFEMYGGVISGNTAYSGGGVYNYMGVFEMYGGVIFGNTSHYGGDVYNYMGVFEMYGGMVE